MSLKAHRMLSVAMHRLERGENKKDILRAIKSAVEEIQDPFVGDIDEFLIEKNKSKDPNEVLREEESRVDTDHPQEDAEEKLEDEELYQPSTHNDPQEEAKEKLEDEQINTNEEKLSELEQRKLDIQTEIDKVQQQNEQYAESSLRNIAALAKDRGYLSLANKFYKVTASGIIDILNNLLMKEYLQRDIFVNYYYVFDDSHSQYLKQHFDSEKGRMVNLQKLIVDAGGTPTLTRLAIPPVNPLSSEGVMALVAEMEKQAVSEYLSAAESLEGLSEYAAIKVWLESVAKEEADDLREMENL